MIIFTEWDLSVIIESHLNKNPFYHSLSDELQNKIINMVYDYVINVDIPSNILFEKLEYDTDLLEYFLWLQALPHKK